MKKLMVLALSVVVMFCMVGCGGTSAEDAEAEDAAKQAAEEPAAVVSEGFIGDCYISIGEIAYSTDDEGNRVAIINYDFTNNGDEASSFDLVTMTYAYQDGIELDKAYFVDSGYDYDLSSKKIQPNATLTVQEAFVLTSDTSDIAVEVTEFASLEEVTLSKTFSQQ